MPPKRNPQSGQQQSDFKLTSSSNISKLLTSERLKPDHPERPPNWRWQIALQYSRASNFPDCEGDNAIYLATRFAKKLRYLQEADGSDIDLSKEEREFCIAWDIYVSGASSRRHELEARLLANENYEDINKKMVLPARTITIYESTFYNVSDRLNSPSYIIHHAIGIPFDENTRVINDYKMWKLMGYWCGPIAVDTLVFSKPPVTPENENKPRDELLRDYLRDKIFYILQQTKLKGSDDLFQLFQAFSKLQQLLVSDLGTLAHKQFIEDLRTTLNSIHWTNTGSREYIDVSFDRIDNYAQENMRLSAKN